jgi:hypothetical protein
MWVLVRLFTLIVLLALAASAEVSPVSLSALRYFDFDFI